MRIALDTNVVVSGLLAAAGAPARIVDLVASGALSVCHDPRILAEYREVLGRPRFGFSEPAIQGFLQQVVAGGLAVAPVPLPAPLPDPDDAMFLEAALAGAAEALVTGNLRHFPPDRRVGVRILPPREFLAFLGARFT